MNERVYQGIVGVLLVVVSVAFYQLYKKDNQKNVISEVAKGVDIADMKPDYQRVSSKELLMQQQRRNTLDKVKLNSSLAELRSSTEKSLEMIKNYNLKNPNNPIDIDLAYDFDTVEIQAQPSFEQIQQEVKATNERFEMAKSSSSENGKTSHDNASDNYGRSYGGGSGGSTSQNLASNESSVPTSTQDTTSTADDTTETSSTDEEVDGELVAYRASINSITQVIEQINNNLN